MEKPNKTNIKPGSFVYACGIEGLPFNQVSMVVGVGFENMYIPRNLNKLFLSELELPNGDLKGLSYEPFPQNADRAERFRVYGFPEEPGEQ